MGILDSLWNGLGNLYDKMHEDDDDNYYDDDNNSSYNQNYHHERVISSGWAVYSDFVGGPVRIIRHYDRSELRCYRAGDISNYHSEFTPPDTFAIHAYWSGDRLYADLSNGEMCEWYAPGCPWRHG